MSVLRFVCHSYSVASVAVNLGWFPGARYTNLRDIKKFERLGFLDIDWRDYNFKKHLECARYTRPMLTVARDVTDVKDLERILNEAFELSQWADRVIVIPKDTRFEDLLPDAIPDCFLLGYSVPTNYGGTNLPLYFFNRPVHLLGGHPAAQRALADNLPVFSFDCNRFTLDATFGDFFDGETFRPHPVGGYDRCITDSISNINRLWVDYAPVSPFLPVGDAL